MQTWHFDPTLVDVIGMVTALEWKHGDIGAQSSFSWLFALNVSGIFSIVPWSLKKLHAKYLWLFYWILLEWNTFPKQILFFLQLIKVQVLKKIIFSRWGIRPIHDNFKVNMNIDVTVAVVMLKQSIGMVRQNYTFTYIYK